MTHEDNRPLNEILAERLYHLVPRASRHDFRPWNSISHDERHPFLLYANEAIRLAEWARYNCSPEGTDARPVTIRINPLSLPPADWKIPS